MPKENKFFELVYADNCVQGYVQALLSKMEFQFPFLRVERQDFQQEMWAEAALAMEKYNPSGMATPGTFACVIMQRKLARLIHKALPQKNHEFTLEIPLGTEEEEDSDTGVKPIVALEPNETLIGGFTAADVRETVSRLPPVERRICELFLSGQSMNAIRISLNIAHTAFYGEILPALRRHFKQLSDCVQ